MTKLFKNTKQVLALVLAFAVLAVSLFTGMVITSDAASCDTDKNIVYAVGNAEVGAWNAADGSFMTGDTAVGSGTESDPYILSTPGHFRYLAQNSTYAATHGKYFAVDPDIDIMVFQYESYMNNNGGLEAFLALSPDEVKTFFATNTSSIVTYQSGAGSEYFGGHIDGNGVELVGINTTSGGLFGKVSEGASFENITISNSYITSGDYSGTLVAYAACSAEYTATGLSNSNCPGVVSFEKCIVANNYIASTGNNQRAGALMGGGNTYIGVKMNNCLVYGNAVVGLKDAANPVDMNCLFGSLSTGHNGDAAGYNNGSYSNSIILDCVPYASYQSNQAYKCFYYTNIYTNMPQTDYTPSGAGGTPDSRVWDNYDITTIDTANAKGSSAVAAMPNLDWADTWIADDEGYPELRAFHDEFTLTQSANGHIETCTTCGVGGTEIAHTYGTDDKCVCGALRDCGSNIIYWDGTYQEINTTAHAGTADDPYIIENAEQLAYLALKTDAAPSAGKYYKMADGIDIIIAQPESLVDASEIMALADANAVKAYFDGLSGKKNWVEGYAWKVFDGNFDGNNVTIYGLYAANNISGKNFSVGLFPQIDGGNMGASGSPATDNTGVLIENIAVKNSCFDGGAMRVGAIFGETFGQSYGAYVNGTVSIESCAAVNNYMVTSRGEYTSGVLIGNSNGEIIKIDSCLVYGNYAKNTNKNVDLPLFPNGEGGRVIGKDGETDIFAYNTVTNTISIGAAPYNSYLFSYRCSGVESFENVYTDAPAGEVTWNINSSAGTPYVVNFAETDIKQITATTGADIVAQADNLDWVGTWIATAGAPELRAYHILGDIQPAGAQGHTEACSCGIAGVVATEHSFDTTGNCSDCGYTCTHGTDGDAFEWTSNNDGDCLNADTGKMVCSLCGFASPEINNPNFVAGHTYTNVEAVSSTCTEAGTIAHKLCEVCDSAYAVDAAIDEPFENALSSTTDAADGHIATEDTNGGVIYQMDDGSHWEICEVCDEEINKVLHNGDYNYDADGHTGACDVCGYEADEKVAHSFDATGACGCGYTCAHGTDGDAFEWISNNNGDCLNADTGKMVCSLCGFASPEINNPNFVAGHTPAEAVKENVVDVTCTEDGSYDSVVYCSVCEDELSREAQTVDALGHTPLDAVEENVVDATCTEDGSKDVVVYCEVCEDEISRETETIDALGHDTKLQAATEPTCTEEGRNEFYLCNNCHLTYADADATTPVAGQDIAIAATGHTLEAVAEVAATTEKTGTKAHYACENCDALFADAEGETAVTAEELVIAKLVVEDNKDEDNDTEGDKSETSPATGETVMVVVAAVAVLLSAAFILVRKARKA